jgi:NADPH-dependent 2,4-dienoyl-CoA reductase/sulfur reductase-like enzyme
MQRYVIVGNGVAGHRAAIELRRLCNDADITLIGADIDRPYDRTALSKDFLLGQRTEADILLRDASDYDRHGIDYLPGTLVENVDGDNRFVFAGGKGFPYDSLLLATGSRPRRLPADLDNGKVFYLRTLQDARELARALQPGLRVAVIGGGFIGLEVAAAARMHGCEVTVVEAQPSVLTRAMPPAVSLFMRRLHEDNGVAVRCGETVRSIDWRSGSAIAVELADSVFSADLVVCGLGIEPNVDLARKIGLPIDDGILVDHGCRTADPEIFAAGEVTSHPTGRLGTHRRIESWRMASDQPLVAAANMAGGQARYLDAAWLWSDQYDVNLQSLGEVLDGTTYLIRGRFGEKKWTLIALDEEERPIGAVAANNGRDISMLRRTMAAGGPLPAALLADSRQFDGSSDAEMVHGRP